MSRPRTPIDRDCLRAAVSAVEGAVDPEECVFRLSDVQAYFQADVERLLACCEGQQPLTLAAETDRSWYVLDRGMLEWSGVLDHVGIDDGPLARVVRECHRTQAERDGIEVDTDAAVFVIRKPIEG